MTRVAALNGLSESERKIQQRARARRIGTGRAEVNGEVEKELTRTRRRTRLCLFGHTGDSLFQEGRRREEGKVSPSLRRVESERAFDGGSFPSSTDELAL